MAAISKILPKSGYYNPVAMLNNSTLNTKSNNLIASFTTQVKLPFGLTYDLNLSYQNSSTLQGVYYTKYFTSNYNSMYDNPDPAFAGHTQQTFGVNGQARPKFLPEHRQSSRKLSYLE